MRNTTVVLDASVGIAWFTNESKSDMARMLLAAAEDGVLQFCVPPLFFMEVGNILLRKKGFSAEKTNSIFARILTLPLQTDIESNEKMLHRNAVAERWQLTSYDAEYLTTAIEQDTVLVTEDRELLKIAEHCVDLEAILKEVDLNS